MRYCSTISSRLMMTAVLAGLLWESLHSNLMAQDLALDTVLLEGEDWQLVGEGYKFTEGPAVDKAGQVYFTDIPNSKIYKIATDGNIRVFVEHSDKTNGLMFGPNGKLYGCQSGSRKIVAYDTITAMAETIVDDIDCNDLVVNQQSGIYVTDPPGGRVWYISPERRKSVVAEGIKPNGVILTPDQGTLVVTEGLEAHLWTFRVNADGTLASRDRYYGPLRLLPGSDRPGSDGMTVDSVGRLYVATRAGLQMFDPIGRMGGVIHKPHPDKPLSNVVFGGEKMDTLYVTCGDQVYRRLTKATGVRYFKP